MGRDTAADAGQALRLLNSPELRHRPVTGPTERRTPAAAPGTPLNLVVLDHRRRCVAEVTEHVQELNPDPTPAPPRIEGLYAWYTAQTLGAERAEQLARDLIIERHNLEHAIALGETDVVRKYPCPACGSWGLMWDGAGKRARCSDIDCRTPDGMASAFTPARLAAQAVQRTEIWRRNAT